MSAIAETCICRLERADNQGTVSDGCWPFCVQNSGLGSLLARLEGILGPVPGWMRARGRYAHRFYTRAGALYRHSPATVSAAKMQ